MQDLQAIAEESWISHEGVACTGMSWERMRSADCIKVSLDKSKCLLCFVWMNIGSSCKLDSNRVGKVSSEHP